MNVSERKIQMTMTSLSEKVSISLVGTGTATINWGDGTESLICENIEDIDDYKHTYLDVFAHTITITGEKITGLKTYKNQLTELDVSGNATLTELECWFNQLTTLDVSKNTALTWLDCSFNQLTALNVRKNTALEWLFCDNNQITELDVSKNTMLENLDCRDNQLTALDVSNNTALTGMAGSDFEALNVSKNQFTAAALNALFMTMPVLSSEIAIFENPGTDDCDESIAEAKGWNVRGSNKKMTMTTLAGEVSISCRNRSGNPRVGRRLQKRKAQRYLV